MKLSRDKKIRLDPLALAFAIPCVGMLFVMMISQYAPFGQYSMLYSDMYHQYYPFFVAFRDALRSGDGLLYTWSVGLGMDYLGLIAYYLASPLNLLSVLVPEGWLLDYFSLMMPVKLGFAGLFFALFLRGVFGKKDVSIAFFGGFYGLCAWALGFQWNIMWLDTFAVLPLVVLGMVGLLKEKKFILYTFSLFFSISANYYIGFFTCIFVFLLFFVYQFCRWGGWKKFFSDLLRIAFFSALSIAMTAVLSLPAFSALQSTQSSVNQFPTGFRLNIASSHDLKGLLDAMRQVAGNMGGALEPNFKEGLPNLYCGIGSVVWMMLFVMAKDIGWKDKVCALALLVFFNVSFIIRQLDYIWHGFHFTNMIPYRFSFLYSFVVLYMAYRAWLLRRKFSPWQVLASAVLAAAVLACSNELKETIPWDLGSVTLDFPVYLVYNLVFLVLYLMAMLYGSLEEPIPEDAGDEERMDWRIRRSRQRKAARILLLVIMGVELAANLMSFGLYFVGTNVVNYPKGTNYTASVIRYMKEREKDLFYRAETTHSQTLNDGALNHYNGVSAFTSSANVKTTLFMQSLGYSAKNTYNRYLFEESSPVSNLFLGLKYMIDRDNKDKTSTFFTEANGFKEVTLLENQAYLPLGFLAEETLATQIFDTTGDFSFQNSLFGAATGLPASVWYQIPGEHLTVRGNGVTLTDNTGYGFVRYSEAMGNSNVTYSYVAAKDGFCCIRLDLPKRNNYYVSINGLELYSESISLPQMIAVGDVKTGDLIEVRVICNSGEASTMDVKAAILDCDLFWRGYEILNASTWQLTKFENDHVEGVIDCNRDGLMYTSIPQNGNWQVTVDGEPVETILVGDCMAAVKLTEGVHRVAFRYQNPAFSLGWKISAVSFMAYGLMAWLYLGKPVPGKKNKGRFQR